MSLIINLIKNRVSQTFLANTAKDAIMLQETNIVNANTENLYEGKDSDDRRIVPDYVESTKRKKKAKGQPTNRVTLRDSGELYENFKVQANDKEAVILSSRTEKGFDVYGQLKKKYGAKVVGINQKEQNRLKSEIIKAVVGKIKR